MHALPPKRQPAPAVKIARNTERAGMEKLVTVDFFLSYQD